MFSTPNPNDSDSYFGEPSPDLVEAVRAADRGDAINAQLPSQNAEPLVGKLPRFPQVELYAKGGGIGLRFKKD